MESIARPILMGTVGLSDSRRLVVLTLKKSGPAAFPRGCAGSRPFASEERWVGEVQESAWRGKGAGLSDITHYIAGFVVCLAWASTSPGPSSQDRGEEGLLGWDGSKKEKKKLNIERVGPVVYDHEPESCSDGPGRQRLSQARSTEALETVGEPASLNRQGVCLRGEV